ncbi:NUDIX domain-containing protein [Fuerstiella marisgermanici]|uniref:GDP-mannose pyrophosphatase n=1 Tax=Fuerstiella marisgermanici TaxID=1891926 RepID=A0A1P8WM07_9PLAN|nr:NUDIX hydrolase [Fuerstiella marisgermanici]APZ95077.1 ADP-ribose pyrophosphatase [Fuerstiella marisgermanici]
MQREAGRSYGPWQILKTTEAYRDPWLKVEFDDVVRPDGNPGTHSVVTIKPGVCVLAFQDDHVFLTEEFHYAVGRVTIEAVSGGREDDEPPLICAQRELAEELGIVADSWTELTTVDPFTASVVSPTTLFLATDLSFQDANPEGTEQIRCVKMTAREAFDAVCAGQITHTPSCIVILQHWIRRQLRYSVSR